MNRVDIHKILNNPKKRKQMVAGTICFLASLEGRDISMDQAGKIYDKVMEDKKI